MAYAVKKTWEHYVLKRDAESSENLIS